MQAPFPARIGCSEECRGRRFHIHDFRYRRCPECPRAPGCPKRPSAHDAEMQRIPGRKLHEDVLRPFINTGLFRTRRDGGEHAVVIAEEIDVFPVVQRLPDGPHRIRKRTALEKIRLSPAACDCPSAWHGGSVPCNGRDGTCLPETDICRRTDLSADVIIQIKRAAFAEMVFPLLGKL